MHRPDRRGFLKFSLFAATAAVASPAVVRAGIAERRIAFHNLHTGERVRTVYWAGGDFVADGLHEIDRVLRDFRTDEVRPIDPGLIDALHRLRDTLGSREAFGVISGYRSPATNAMLRGKSGGVAKKSYHMRGMAVDVRLPGVDLKRLHRAALALRTGGVGYYPRSEFVHLDTGRVRAW